MVLRPKLWLPKKRHFLSRRAFLAGGAAALCSPAIIRAQSLGGNSGISQAKVKSSGGGGYVAKAVHFDGTAWLRNSSLIGGDGHFLSFSWWIQADVNSGPIPTIQWVVDPENNYTSAANIETDGATPGPGTQFIQMGDVTGSKYVSWESTVRVDDGNWHNIIFSGQTNLTGTNVCKLFVDDVDVGVQTGTDRSPFEMVFNAVSFWFGNDGSFPYVGNFSDVWIAPNSYLIDGSGTIPVATRRLFIDGSGKPANPSGFPASAILFSGDHTTFPTNQGTGGAFTLTGILTNASTSPSD